PRNKCFRRRMVKRYMPRSMPRYKQNFERRLPKSNFVTLFKPLFHLWFLIVNKTIMRCVHFYGSQYGFFRSMQNKGDSPTPFGKGYAQDMIHMSMGISYPFRY